GPFSAKLAGTFLLVLILLVGAALFAISQLVRSAGQREQLARRHLEDVVLAERLRSTTDAAVAAGRGYLIVRDREFLVRLEDAEAAFDAALTDLLARETDPSGNALLHEVRTASVAYKQAQDRILAAKGESVPFASLQREFETEVI